MKPSGRFPLSLVLAFRDENSLGSSQGYSRSSGSLQANPLPRSPAIMATVNWRTINIDLLDPESSANFDISSLLPSSPSISASEVQKLSSQIKQLLRGGDSEGALRGALENAPYGSDAQAKVSKAPLCEVARGSGEIGYNPCGIRVYCL